jgi:hypothetical protein
LIWSGAVVWVEHTDVVLTNDGNRQAVHITWAVCAIYAVCAGIDEWFR